MGSGAASPLLRVKMLPPSCPAQVQVRPGVHEVLDRRARVTAVVGPAGFGKTTAVADWASRSGEPLAWVTIDRFDDRPTLFWRYLTAAIFEAFGLHAGADERAEEGSAPDGESLVADLLVALASRPVAGVVVLDDLHHVGDSELLDQVARVVERAPAGVRFVVLARVRPELPWGRWAMRGMSAEVDEAQLAMDDDEASALVRAATSLELPEEALRCVVEAAAGWPAALRLAAVALGHHDRPERYARTLATHDRLLFDFVATEVLAALAPEVRRAVIVLSLLDDLDPRRCELLAGTADGAGLLDGLARSGIPMVALDPVSATYRFHALFRQVVAAELRRTRAAELPDLHRRAAEVELTVGDEPAAVRHLIAAGDLDSAFRIVFAPLGDVYRNGSVRRLAEWIDRFPPDFIGADAGRAAAYSQALFWINRTGDAIRWSNLACDLAGSEPPVRLGIALALPRMLVALGSGDTDRVRRQLARLCQSYGPEVVRSDREAMLPTVAAIAALVDEAPDARTWVQAIASRPDIPERVLAVGYPTRRAWELFQRGRLDEAQDLAESALDAGARDGRAALHAVIELFSLVANLHLERNELETAAYWACRATERTERMESSSHRFLADAASIAVVEARSGPAAALSVLEGSLRRRTPAAIRDRYFLLGAEIEARTGSLAVAAGWLGGLPPTPRRQLVQARLAVTRGHHHEAEELLAGLGPLPLARRVEAELLRSRLASRPQTPRSQTLRGALDVGTSAGYVWTYLREGRAMVDALRTTVDADPRLRRTALGRHLADRANHPVSDADRLAERTRQSLTPMELTVLAHLPSHRSLQEIAAELFLSVNTVKTHSQSVYRKLGVNTRAEAVGRAGTLGLID